MSGLRFRVGELAIVVVCPSEDGPMAVGQIVEIKVAGPISPMQSVQRDGHWYSPEATSDYAIEFSNGLWMFCNDIDLRKIDPPAEPASLTRECDVEVTV